MLSGRSGRSQLARRRTRDDPGSRPRRGSARPPQRSRRARRRRAGACVVARDRTHFCSGVGRITDADRASLRCERLFERLRDAVRDDEPLRGDAALPGILESRLRSHRGGRVDISVVEHHEGIRASQLEHALLEVGAGDTGRRRRPASVLPVMLTAWMRGSAMTAATRMPRGRTSIVNTPSGKPASATRVRQGADRSRVTLFACLRMTQFPRQQRMGRGSAPPASTGSSRACTRARRRGAGRR